MEKYLEIKFYDGNQVEHKHALGLGEGFLCTSSLYLLFQFNLEYDKFVKILCILFSSTKAEIFGKSFG